MKIKFFIHTLKILALVGVLSGCGGSDSSETANTFLADYERLTKADIQATVLAPATAESLERHLKNGIRLNVRSNARSERPNIDGFELVNDVSDSTQSEFSPTNTQVLGVDEADFVKYDGRYIYMTTEPEYLWGSLPSNAAVRILETDPANAGVREIATIPISNDQWGEVSQLYLVGDDTQTQSLVTLRSTWNFIAASEPIFTDSIFIDTPAPYANKIQLRSYDLSDPSTPEQDFDIEIDGYLQASRKIGNTLYLVTQFSPYLPMINFYIADEDEAQRNEQKIEALELDDLLPKVSVNGASETPLVSAEDCLLPVNTSDNSGYLNMVTLVAVDLSEQSVRSAKCLNASVQGIYANGDNLYIGASKGAQGSTSEALTVVHKFGLTEELSYRATGIVPGLMGWSNPSFRMDEYQGNLRIVTTEQNIDSNPRHRLSVLQESANSDELILVAELPNEANPATIGKPGEDIYSVRFMGNRAYVVTFERIDPLYVIDLSDPLNPNIAGELEVPGFSTYLHPIGDDYLLGLGQEISETGAQRGLKMSLFDIRDISAPTLVGSELIGERGTWSSALYDLRALSFLSPNPDELRLVFPASNYGANHLWETESLHLMEVNGLESGNANLLKVGEIISETSSEGYMYPNFSGTDRGILHGDAVYYVHGNSIWSSFWDTSDNPSGPH